MSVGSGERGRKGQRDRGGQASRLFGYDIFISFALGSPPRGSRSYASDLARQLRENDFTVFFSEEEAAVGERLDGTLTAALRTSKMLVVVANRGTLADPRWVKTEVQEYLQANPSRPVIPINIDGALQDSALSNTTQEWLPWEGKIWVDDTQQACDSGAPSEDAVRRLLTAPSAMRANKKWRWTQVGVASGLLALAVIAGGFAWSDRQSKALAQRNEATAVANAERASKFASEAADNAEQSASNAAQAQSNERVALQQRERAKSAEATARGEAENARLAARRELGQRLVAESQLARTFDTRLALLLAREAWAVDPSMHARRALFSVLGEPVAVPLLDGLRDITRVARSTDGRFVAVNGLTLGSSEADFRLLRFESGRLVNEETRLPGWVSEVAFSSDGRILATLDRRREVQFWDTESRSVGGKSFNVGERASATAITWIGGATAVAVLASRKDESTITLWDPQAGRELAPPLRGLKSDGTSFVTAGLGSRVLAALSGGRAYAWDLQSYELIANDVPFTDARSSAGFQSQARLRPLMSTADEVAWGVWATERAGDLTPGPWGHDVAFAGRANVVAYIHRGEGTNEYARRSKGSIQLRDYGTGQYIGAPLILATDSPVALAIDTDARELIAAYGRGSVAKWMINTGMHRFLSAEHQLQRYKRAQLSVSDDGGWVALIHPDGVIERRRLSADSGSSMPTATDKRLLVGNDEEPHVLGRLLNGGLLAVSHDGSVVLSDLRDLGSALIPPRESHPRCMTGEHADQATFSPDGNMFATSSAHSLGIWIWRSGDCGLIGRIGERDVHSNRWPFVFSSDSRSVFVANEMWVSRFDISNRLRKSETVYKGRASELAVDPLGRFLILKDAAGWLVAIDLRAGMQPKQFELPSADSVISRLSVSPDGRLVAAILRDRGVWLWDTQTGEIVGSFPNPWESSSHLVFRSDSKALISGSKAAETFAAWNVNADDWAGQACELAQRNFSCAEWNRFFGLKTPYERRCSRWPLPTDANQCAAPMR